MKKGTQQMPLMIEMLDLSDNDFRHVKTMAMSN